MNKKVNRLVKGLGFFSIVVGLVFIGLVYVLKKDLMIAEIGKLFDYTVDFMFHREWIGRVLVANVMVIASVVMAICWMILCIKKKRLANGVFGSMGLLGSVGTLFLVYRYRNSLIGNMINTPKMGQAILMVIVFFLILMVLNAMVSVGAMIVDGKKTKDECKVVKFFDNVALSSFAVFVILTAVGGFLALSFRFEGMLNRAPKFYHFVLDLLNITKWDASNIVVNFSAFVVVLCALFWLVYNLLKKKLPVGPLSLIITCGLVVALNNYKDTFAFYIGHPSFYLHLVVVAVYALLAIAALGAVSALVADCLLASCSNKKVDVINIRIKGGKDAIKTVEPVVEPTVTEPVVEEVKEPVVEETVDEKEEEPVVEEPEVETQPEEEPESVELGGDLIEVVDENNKKLIINKRVYTNKLCLASDDLKKNYNIVKNAILKYNKVRSRISSNYESFRKGRKLLVRFNILGKTLRVYLALDPNEYPVTVYHQRDEGSKSKYQLVPMMLRVRSPRSVRNAVKLIDELMEKEGLQLINNYEEVDYAKEFKYDSNALLIKDGYKKLLREEIDEGHADELSDDEAMRVVVNKEVTVDETQTKFVDRNQKVNKSIVNVDQINQVFEYNEYVTLEKLKEKGLVNKKTNYVKVLSRGVINKPMTIEADEFSLKAVKMIVLTGGSVVRLVSK